MTDIKITMTLLVCNEQDIIEDNIRFHDAMGVDNFIVMDNCSTDKTAQILKKLSEEFDIHYIFQPENDYQQAKWVTQMAQMAATQFHADWIINNDADEFWLPNTGDLKGLLAATPQGIDGIKATRFNAVVMEKPESARLGVSHPRTSAHFERASKNALGSPLPPKLMHRAYSHIRISQGNHNAHGLEGDIIDGRKLLKILHFPYRSLPQYKSKIQTGGAAYERNTTLAKTIGNVWRKHYRVLEDGGIDEFWGNLTQNKIDLAINMAKLRITKENRLVAFFKKLKNASSTYPLDQAVNNLISQTQIMVDEYLAEQKDAVSKMPPKVRIERPRFYNLEFTLKAPNSHLSTLKDITQIKEPQRLSEKLPELRDCFSLFPRNKHLRTFLAEILNISHSEDVEKLRSDCQGKRVILHICCHHRADQMIESLASFKPLPDEKYHHIILMGNKKPVTEDNTDLSFSYDGEMLCVPAPDSYEHLHRKIFYAFMLFDLLTEPELLIKIDDDIVLQNSKKFMDCMDFIVHEKAAYAGRPVGAPRHEDQIHGWHIDKCADAMIEQRGYQYPLPQSYANGGYGYILSPKGIAMCSYMYLSMKEFFNQRAVGLEDVCTGHAAYAAGLELLKIDNLNTVLCIPGLTTKARQKIDT